MQKTKINHEGIELEIRYYYEPAEDPSFSYPGSPEIYEIRSIYYQGVDVYEIYRKNELLEEIEDILAS